MDVREGAGGFPWDHEPWWIGKAACVGLAVVHADLAGQAGAVQEAESVLMSQSPYYAQSLSEFTDGDGTAAPAPALQSCIPVQR